MTWNKAIRLVVDVDAKVEPLLGVDSASRWAYVKIPELIQGDTLPVEIEFRTISGGITTVVSQEADDSLSLVIRKLGVSGATGDPLATVAAFTQGVDEWTGELELNTTNLDAAMGSYPSLKVRYELALLNSDDGLKASWQWDGELRRRVWSGVPASVDGEPSYYTQAEADAIFARKDGPSGYAQKLVAHEGLWYWAQLVDDKWVIPKIIEVSGYYTITFVEI